MHGQCVVITKCFAAMLAGGVCSMAVSYFHVAVIWWFPFEMLTTRALIFISIGGGHYVQVLLQSAQAPVPVVSPRLPTQVSRRKMVSCCTPQLARIQALTAPPTHSMGLIAASAKHKNTYSSVKVYCSTHSNNNN